MKYTAIIAAVIGLVLAAPAADARERPSTGAERSQSAHTPTFGRALPPIGWLQFCRDNRAECVDQWARGGEVAMTRARLQELVALNRRVNAEIEAVTDMDHFGVAEFWTYPVAGRGDCEDYVLLKRRMLMDRGWPQSALLITVVRDQRGDGHAVLTVRTSDGDFVLDNVRDEVLPWYQTGYRFVRRQSPGNPMAWEALSPEVAPQNQTVAAPR